VPKTNSKQNTNNYYLMILKSKVDNPFAHYWG